MTQYFIKINSHWVHSVVTPEELTQFKPTVRRRGEKPKNNQFRTNPLKTVQYLCRKYKVYFYWSKAHILDNKNVKIYFEIPAMNIYLHGEAPSTRKAKMIILYKLHKTYAELLKTVDEIKNLK